MSEENVAIIQRRMNPSLACPRASNQSLVLPQSFVHSLTQYQPSPRCPRCKAEPIHTWSFLPAAFSFSQERRQVLIKKLNISAAVSRHIRPPRCHLPPLGFAQDPRLRDGPRSAPPAVQAGRSCPRGTLLPHPSVRQLRCCASPPSSGRSPPGHTQSQPLPLMSCLPFTAPNFQSFLPAPDPPLRPGPTPSIPQPSSF